MRPVVEGRQQRKSKLFEDAACVVLARERGVYVQPLDVQTKQACPRLVAYQRELLSQAQKDGEGGLPLPKEEQPGCIYTYTDGDIRETLPFLLMRSQQAGGARPYA